MCCIRWWICPRSFYWGKINWYTASAAKLCLKSKYQEIIRKFKKMLQGDPASWSKTKRSCGKLTKFQTTPNYIHLSVFHTISARGFEFWTAMVRNIWLSTFIQIVPWITIAFVVLHLLKEMVQIAVRRGRYFKEFVNVLEIALYISTFLFLLPFLMCYTGA